MLLHLPICRAKTIRSVESGYFFISSERITKQQISDRLIKEGGKHLVIVRYAPKHNFLHEWVYNETDIDQAPVFWARAMDDAHNSRLIEYFKDRRV